MSNLSNQQKATYALLADNVYWDVRYGYKKGDDLIKDFTNSNWTPVPDGWKIIDEVSGSGDGRTQNPELEGFTARVFQHDKTGEIVISYAGTDDSDVSMMAVAKKGLLGLGSDVSKSGDIMNDIQMGLGGASEQANQAALLYQKIRHTNPDATITFTGHSLGGGLAGIMGVIFDKPAVIFDPAPFKQAA